MRAVKIGPKSEEDLKRDYPPVLIQALLQDFPGWYFLEDPSHRNHKGMPSLSVVIPEAFEAKYQFVVDEDETDFSQVVRRK